MATEHPTPPRPRAPGAPVRGRRPRAASAAELVGDVVAELEAPVEVEPAALRRTPSPRRTAPRATAPRAPRAARAPRPAPARDPQAAPEIEIELIAVPRVVVLGPADRPGSARVIDAVRRRPRVRLTPRRVRTILAACAIVAMAGSAGLLLSLRTTSPAGPPNLVTVLPRASTDDTLTMADATALADPSVVPDANAVAPIVQSSETVRAGGHQASTTLTGTTGGWMAVMHRALAQGTPLTSAQVTSGDRVAIIGSFVADALFPGVNAVGKTVSIRATNLTVVGVLSPPAGTTSSLDDVTLVPISTGQGLVSGAGRVDRILVAAPDADSVFTAYQEVNSLLLQTHHASNPFAADFTVTTDAGTASRTGLRLALGAAVVLALAIAVVTVRSSRRGG